MARRNEFKVHVRREEPEIFLVVSRHFLALRVQLVVFGERFRDGQYSLVSFLFAVHLFTVPVCPAICINGRPRVSLFPMESAPLLKKHHEFFLNIHETLQAETKFIIHEIVQH